MVTKPGTFGAWLQSKIDRRGWNARDLAAAMGIAPQTVYRWLGDERTPDPPYCRRIADALGLHPDEVFAAAGHRPLDVPVSTYEINRRVSDLISNVRQLEEVIEREPAGILVPVYGRVPADTIRYTQDEGLEPVRVVEEDLNGARNPFGLVVTGPCMESIGIYPGDVVILDRDPNRKPSDGELVVVRTEDGVTFKRWCVMDRNTVELREGDGTVAATLHPLMDDYTIEGFYVTFKPRAKR